MMIIGQALDPPSKKCPPLRLLLYEVEPNLVSRGEPASTFSVKSAALRPRRHLNPKSAQAVPGLCGVGTVSAIGLAIESELKTLCSRRSFRPHLDLKWCLSIRRLLIFVSRVDLGIPSFAAAPDGPAT